MKDVYIVAPDWGNPWLPIYKKMLIEAGFNTTHVLPDKYTNKEVDACIHMWARSNKFIDYSKFNIMFMRGYEFFDPNHWTKIQWDKIDHLVLCNQWTKNHVDAYFKDSNIDQKTHLVYNAVDTSNWTYKNRTHGNKIGMACHIHQKKNIPIAMQILANLPYGYELHIAGAIQDIGLVEYIKNVGIAIGRSIQIYGHIPADKMDEWWDDKHYCLSTSIREGNPNNVLEAMAKGIKPIVHAWPGAEHQFDNVFYTVVDATAEILRGPYKSADYRDKINNNHSLTNYEKIVKLIQGGI